MTIEMRHRPRAIKCHGVSHHSFPAVFASLLATVIALSTLWSRAMLAASDCITEPKLQAAQDGHWYYHLDPANHRKCWYVSQPAVKVPQAASLEARSPPQPPSDSRNTGTVGAERRKNDEALQNESRIVRRSDSRAVASQERAAPPALKKRSYQPGIPLNEAARDALFREFLRWQERQNQRDPSLNQASRDALFREFLLWEERQEKAER